MHTLITYNGDEKRALRDARKWLGPRRYNELAKAVAAGTIPNEEYFHNLCGFAGIEGFPVQVMWKAMNKQETN